MKRTVQTELPETRIGEIPVQASVGKARVVSVAAISLLGLGLLAAMVGPPLLMRFLSSNPEVSRLFEQRGTTIILLVCFQLLGALGAICALCGVVSLRRSAFTWKLLRSVLFVVYPLVAIFVWQVWSAGFAILAADSGKGLDIDGQPQDPATIILLWWRVCLPALGTALFVFWLHVMLRSRSVYDAFTGRAGEPMDGDRMLEDLRTHGRDPQHRRSLYHSALTHILILIVIPWLMEFGGCVEAYRVPKGSGEPVVAMVKMVKPKKKKKKNLSLRPNSAIIFEVPDLDDTEVDQVMDEQTQVTYVAAANAKAGKMGKGGGTEGGWPAGMEKYKIRFIRLDHGGAGWDDGMDDSSADMNFLRAFAQATGFNKIASKGESHSIALLAKYPDDGFPPFVYLTGNAGMGSVRPKDAEILREYCLKGGMLIADAGSAVFHRSFVDFITRQVFPDKPLLDIADDDMIYQLPYGFPDGAPSFWHHGGRRALGMKHEGRWIVFYHPGDMNDAWKSQGYTDVTPEMRQSAMNLGINLVYYSFNQWDDAVTKARK